MKSKIQMVKQFGKFLSDRAVTVSAVVTALAVILGCASVAFSGNTATVQSGNALTTDGGTILKAVGESVETEETNEIAEITNDGWNFNAVDLVVVSTFSVKVTADGVTRTVVMESGTVADALVKADVVLGEDDIISLPAETVLTADTSITIDRVTFEERTEVEVVPFGSSSYETADYDKGESVVVTNGVNGEKTVIYRDRYVNGELVETTVKEETVTKAPVDQVTAIGTYVKPVQTIKPSAGGSTPDFSYSAVYYGKGTAYTNENGLCGEYTASGMKAQVGVVAVNPNVIPYGTRLYITTPDGSYTYGYCVAGDTGGFIYSHPDTIVDVFFNTAAECYQFGRRDVIVYVLD